MIKIDAVRDGNMVVLDSPFQRPPELLEKAVRETYFFTEAGIQGFDPDGGVAKRNLHHSTLPFS